MAILSLKNEFVDFSFPVFIERGNKKSNTKKSFPMDESTSNQAENLLFPELFSIGGVNGKPIEVSFTAPDLSSEGGLLLLREFDQRVGFTVVIIFVMNLIRHIRLCS